jgi:predicted nucleic acid-binding protein
MILLDTSSVINFLNGEETTIKALQKLKSKKLATSVITIGELEVGFSRFSSIKQDQIKKAFNKMLSNKILVVFEVNQKIALIYGNLQANLMNKGLSIGGFDGLIAATAIYHNIPLLTSDSGFKRVPGLKLV